MIQYFIFHDEIDAIDIIDDGIFRKDKVTRVFFVFLPDTTTLLAHSA